MIPLYAFFTVVTVLVMAAGRRLTGMRRSPLRTLMAAPGRHQAALRRAKRDSPRREGAQ